MIFIDTHTHLYLKRFDEDRDAMIKRAFDAQVKYMLMPNIDMASLAPMMKLHKKHPAHCLPMIGLHPTSVDKDFTDNLRHIRFQIENNHFYAIGETGMDLYWDATFIEEQKESLRQHILLADKYKLPIVIHSRNAMDEILEVINESALPTVAGVFHCYPGDAQTAVRIVDMGYKIGVGGVITYKKNNLTDVVKKVGLKHIVLETDAPFLPPVPHRGKRNESAYLPLVAKELARILKTDLQTVAEVTTQNATELFKIEL